MVLKKREKIFLMLVPVVLAILVFDRVYYTPQSRRILRLKEEVRIADLKLNESADLTKGVQTLEAEVSRLEGELRRLVGQTLKGEEFRVFLKHLARESDPLQMRIISLAPQEERLASTEGKKRTPAFQFRKVTILLVLHTTYAKLEHYLKEIEELPFRVSVDSLQIEKNEEKLPPLRVTIELSLFMKGGVEGI
jgi:hypothetical protein